MKRFLNYVLMATIAASLTIGFVGCSDDDDTGTTPTGSNPQPIELTELGTIIAATAPPAYTGPTAAPGALADWTGGEHPLLNQVFSDEEPQALYRNIEEFDEMIGVLSEFLMVEADGDIVTGTSTEVYVMTEGDQVDTLHVTLTVSALADDPAPQTEAAYVLGTTVEADYLVTIAIEEESGNTIAFGVRLTDSVQALLQYEYSVEPSNKTSSKIKYARFDRIDSTYTFRGVGYVDYDGSEQFKYSFSVTSGVTGDFSYRNSWYSNGSGYPDFRHTIVGGGNKDTEFALTYRLFTPADTTVPDAGSTLEQVFGPNYTEGTGLISEYSDYVGVGQVYGANTFSDDHFANPFE